MALVSFYLMSGWEPNSMVLTQFDPYENEIIFDLSEQKTCGHFPYFEVYFEI